MLWMTLLRDALLGTEPSQSETSTASSTLIQGGSGLNGGIQMLPTVGSDVLSRFVDVSTIYRTNPWLLAVIGLLSRTHSRLPPKMYQRDRDGHQVRATGRGKDLELILRQPGRGMSGLALMKGTSRDKHIRGNALWRLHTTSLGEITGIERIPWRFTQVLDHSGEVAYRDTRHAHGDHRAYTFLPSEVIHFGRWESDTAINESPISALSSTLALFDAVYTHLISYFGRSARPSGHFHVAPEADDEVVDEVARQIKEYFVGPANAGRILITSAEWQTMSDNPDHSKVIELAKQSREEICGVYGVAPPLVGILDRAIMSNVRELREHTTRDTVGPYVEEADASFNAQLQYHHPLYKRWWLESETAANLKADLEGSAATFPNQLRIMTIDEVRIRRGLKPLNIEGLTDVPWAPNGGGSDLSGSEGGESKPPEQQASSFRAPTPEE